MVVPRRHDRHLVPVLGHEQDEPADVRARGHLAGMPPLDQAAVEAKGVDARDERGQRDIRRRRARQARPCSRRYLRRTKLSCPVSW